MQPYPSLAAIAHLVEHAIRTRVRGVQVVLVALAIVLTLCYYIAMPYKDPEKQRAYMREWTATRRRNWFAENGPCVDCESWEYLEIDHLDPTQKVSHRIWSWTESRRNKELAKCVVRCVKCHRGKNGRHQPVRSLHGTRNRYDRYGCRCELCSEAKSKHNAKRYIKPI